MNETGLDKQSDMIGKDRIVAIGNAPDWLRDILGRNKDAPNGIHIALHKGLTRQK